MKIKPVIILAALISMLTIDLIVGYIYLPIWACVFIAIIVISITIAYLVSKVFKLLNAFKSFHSVIAEQLTSQHKEVTSGLHDLLNSIQGSISDSLNVVIENNNEAEEKILFSLKEYTIALSEMYMQQQQALSKVEKSLLSSTLITQEAIKSVNELLLKVDVELKTELKKNTDTVLENVSERLTKAVATLNASVEMARKSSEELTGNLLQLSTTQNKEVQNRLSDLSQQTITIGDSITSSAIELNMQLQFVDESLIKADEELKSALQQHTDIVLSNISKSQSGTVTMLANSVKNVKEKIDETAEITFKANKEQNESIQNTVNDIFLKAQNIENTISVVSDNKSKEVVHSLKNLILDLRKELLSSVATVNNQLFDTQVAQESVSRELANIQVILRTTLKSISDSESNIVSQLFNLQNAEAGILSTKSVSQYEIEINANRIETIIDDETKNIVSNYFVDDQLLKSIMKDSKGGMLYELEYASGKIVKSRNYDSKGNLSIEQTYYENGQVHFRNEYRSGKDKITTEFDINGHKK